MLNLYETAIMHLIHLVWLYLKDMMKENTVQDKRIVDQ